MGCGKQLVRHTTQPIGKGADYPAPMTTTAPRGAPVDASRPGIPVVRRARTSDVPEIKSLVDHYSGRILLEKNLVTLYESIQECWVAELNGHLVGCGALHVLWADLGEVRTVAVHPDLRGHGIGHQIVDRLVAIARELQLRRLFVLTFEVGFFSRHGFAEIEGTPVTAEVFAEMCRSYDTGVAEFLDLSYVKPNTLGNTRMLLNL